jgi:lysophospholipase L1-like esterase
MEAFLYGQHYIRKVIDDMRAKKESDQPLDYDMIFAKRGEQKTPPTPQGARSRKDDFTTAYIGNFGFRGKDVDLAKAPGTIRIITMGGSFVYGYGVPDDQTWSYLLEQELKKASGRYEVINGGINSMDINGILRKIIGEIVFFKPDYLIIISNYANHFFINFDEETLLWKIGYTLYRCSLFYERIYRKVSYILFKKTHIYMNFYDTVRLKKTAVDDLVAKYKKRLDQISTICRENGINLILGLQPEVIPGYSENAKALCDEGPIDAIGQKLQKQNYLRRWEFEYYMQGRLNIEMKKFAENNRILLLNNIGAFSGDMQQYFVDHIHLNGKGNALMAETLFSFLLQQGIVRTD